MNNDRRRQTTRFSDRLISIEQLKPDSRQQLEKELHAMFIRELTIPRRISFAIVAAVAACSAAVCGFLAVTEPELPTMARIGLGVGTLFGVAWSIVAVRICWRGALDVKVDSGRIAAMVWVFTVLMMVFFLIVGMSVEDRSLGIMMIANGLAFLIVAGVCWLTHRIEQAELATRERLLQVELRLAELSEER
jgi:MFS family permease